MDSREGGRKTFLDGFNCSQAVLTSFSQRLGLDTETALRIACGFGAGFGREQETCGAVTGGIIVLGLKYGQYRAEDRESKEKTYSEVSRFIKSFREIHGTSRCSDLTGCDLRSEEGRKNFAEEKIKEKVCLQCIENAIGILENMIG